MSASADQSFTGNKALILCRGLFLRCPRCGQGKLFRHWTAMREACPRCGLLFEQEEGYWVGALTLNTVITLLLGAVLLGVTVIASWPDIPVVPVIAIGIGAMVLFPLIFYPISKTLWVALDLVFFNPWRMRPGTGLRRGR